MTELGISGDNIIDVGLEREELADNQYFDLKYFPHSDNETFVDMGAFEGESTLNFIKWANEDYKEIYAFEPDPKNYLMCKEILKNIQNCHLINKGAWSHTTILNFSSNGTIESHVDDSTGNVKVPVTSLDETTNVPITFIMLTSNKACN